MVFPHRGAAVLAPPPGDGLGAVGAAPALARGVRPRAERLRPAAGPAVSPTPGQRLRDWVAASGTTLDRDRPTRQTVWPGEDPTEPVEERIIANRDEDFVQWVLADVAARNQSEDEFYAGLDPSHLGAARLMGTYVKKTARRRYEDQSFSVRAVHRETADLHKLAGARSDPSDLAGDRPLPRRPSRRRDPRDLPSGNGRHPDPGRVGGGPGRIEHTQASRRRVVLWSLTPPLWRQRSENVADPGLVLDLSGFLSRSAPLGRSGRPGHEPRLA